MSRMSRFCVGALVALALVPAAAYSQDPIVVALMTGFSPGSNPGMTQLDTKLQSAFGGGAPPFSSQVFAYTSQTAAANFLGAAPPNARRVLIGHSFGASSNFSLAQNVLGPMGLNVDLQISVDWVSQSTPFQATTPTVPPQILLAYDYHQTSTAFLEPVPSSTIIGAARSLNLEWVFADPSLTHTSIDCDARFHELVIERIRELFMPPTFPGTGEHLDLFCRSDTLNAPCNPAAGIAVPGVLTQNAFQPAQGGQWITLRTISPEGTFANLGFGILGEVFPAGAPPASVLPGIASSLTWPSLVLITPASIQVPPLAFAPLPAPGFDFSFCWPAGLTGTSILFQTVVFDPSAQNGIYATSLGLELQGI